MRNYISSILFFFCLSFSYSAVSATSLPAEHEATRLMIAVEKSIKESNWSKASFQLEELQNLKVDLPSKYHYFNGLVLAELGQFAAAQSSLEQYVVQAEEKGEYYVAALEQLTRIEELSDEELPSATRQASIKPADDETSSDGYIKSLQALYLTEDPVHALVLQINSLLSAHAYTGSRLKKSTERAGIIFSLSVSGRDILLQEKRYQGGQPELRVNKLNVLGLDPFLRSECSGNELMCWIYHPGNGYDQWVIIDRDEMVLNELVEAFSKLIRLMQK